MYGTWIKCVCLPLQKTNKNNINGGLGERKNRRVLRTTRHSRNLSYTLHCLNESVQREVLDDREMQKKIQIMTLNK